MQIKISTGGVLIFASSKGLMREYEEKEFDYDFPKGLMKLLAQQLIIALTTSDGDDLIIEFDDKNQKSADHFDKEIDQFIKLDSDDALLVMSHSDFTRICDNKNGDHTKFGWPINKIDGLQKGTYHLNIKVQNVSKEFEKYAAYFRLILTINKIEEIKSFNEVIEISN